MVKSSSEHFAEYAVQATDLVKHFKSVKAVDGVSFNVRHGETFGIIGPDGAGKTTLFRILTSLILPNSGRALIEGYDTDKEYPSVRNIIGYMPGKFSLYKDLTVEENLKFFATLFGTTIEENYHLIKDIYCQIEPFKNRLAGNLSGGMKQKLALSCALIHKPKVLFLDEPTTGVDPVSRKEFWDMLGRLRDDGISIVVSTPYMDEARRCDRIALAKDGKFLTIDTPQNIINGFPDKLMAVESDRMHSLLGDLRSWSGTIRAFSFGESIHLSVKQDVTEDEVRSFLTSKGHGDIIIRTAEPSVEDCFMKMLQNDKN